MKIKIRHIEYYLPEEVITNAKLAMENPEWDFNLIESKTGIFSRHIVGNSEFASDLAVRAAERVLQKEAQT